MFTAYTLIYTSLLIISGCLQLADASTSLLLGPVGGKGSPLQLPLLTVVPGPIRGSSVLSPVSQPPQSGADGWLRQKSEAAEHETTFSWSAVKKQRNPILRFSFSSLLNTLC